MPSTELMLTLLVATIMFAYLPGPALLYVAARTIAGGRKAGLLAALGMHTGGYVHVIAAAAGLSALFHAVPTLYLIVKLIGAGYLILIGLKMIWQAIKVKDKVQESEKGSALTGCQIFTESVIVEVLNPKTALFFIAFLPQFVDPSATFPVWVQLLIFGTIVNILFGSADIACVFFAGIVVDKLKRSSRTSRLFEGLGGSLLVGLGAHLVLQRS